MPHAALPDVQTETDKETERESNHHDEPQLVFTNSKLTRRVEKEAGEIDSSEGGQSESIGWYVKYRKSKPIVSPQSNRDTNESEVDNKFEFSRGDYLALS